VDKAESEPELAASINRDGAGFVAAAAAEVGAFCVHISTDFIFDGRSGTPYEPASVPNPLSVYGRTKLEGELAVRAACPDAAIVRTAWVYALEGKNFLRTMLRLMAERSEVRVVADQVGTPTHADSVAAAIWALATRRAAGTWHWTDAGVASWYDFAVAIADTAHAMGLLPKRPTVVPIATEEYPTPARRPAYSVLDKRGTSLALGIRPEHWREVLVRTLAASGPTRTL
jgi:dTDP-4-dehydrorhamnose reductase